MNTSLEKQISDSRAQQEITKSLVEVQENSLNKISEEIHDNIGQQLSMARHYMLSVLLQKPEDYISRIKTADEIILTAISDLRSLSHSLSSYWVFQHLIFAINKEVEFVKNAKDVHCSLTVTGDTYLLVDDMSLMIFRIIQEAINNALKHGDPKQILISMDYRPDVLLIEVSDDGHGFQPDENTMNGIGLINMKARANLMKAILNIESGYNSGTKITLQIPTHAEIQN